MSTVVDEIINPPKQTPIQRDDKAPKEVMGSEMIIESPSIRPDELNTELASDIIAQNTQAMKDLKDTLSKLTKVYSQDRPFSMMKIHFKRLSGLTGSSIPSTPSYQYDAKDRDETLNNLAMTLDANFSLHGIILIRINKTPLFPFSENGTSAGDFTDFQTFSLPMKQEGIKLRRGESLEVFAWTDGDATCALTITFGISKDIQAV